MLKLEPSALPRDPWEKILWRRQPFPDNHVDPSFLSELKALPPRPRPRILALVGSVLPISQQLAVISIFLAIFYRMLRGDVGAGEVGWSCGLVGLLAYAVRRWEFGSGQSSEQLLPPETPLRPLILPPLLLSLLSPVLGTLTSATTSDSIWPLAGGLFFVHVLLSDFTSRHGTQGRAKGKDYVEEKTLSSALCLTSALSASVVLASRLPSTAHVFSLITLATVMFAGWPSVAKRVRSYGKSVSAALAISMAGLALVILAPVRILILCILFLVNVVGPFMLWYGWRWKTRREGDWEVAVVRLRKVN